MIEICGIDPGKTGGLARVVFDGGQVIDGEAFRVPHLKIKGKEKIDFVRMSQDWGSVLRQCDEAVIELVSGGSQGHGNKAQSGMFNFGYSAGFAYGIICGLDKPHTFVTPASWKKLVGLSGSDGEESRRRASQLMPGLSKYWPFKKDDGLAEAALICYSRHLVLHNSHPEAT